MISAYVLRIYQIVKEDNAKNIEPDLEVIVLVYDFRMTYTEVLEYIEQNVLPERLIEYENDMRNQALVENEITYIQRAEKNKKYNMPANVTDVWLFHNLIPVAENIFAFLVIYSYMYKKQANSKKSVIISRRH